MAMTLAAAWSGLCFLMLGAGEVTLEEIHAKWRERTERSRSIRLTWDETRGPTKVPGQQITLGKKPGQFRLLDTVLGAPGIASTSRYVLTCDDADCRRLFPGSRGQSGSGAVLRGAEPSFSQLPIAHALRPFEPRLQETTLGQYELTKFRSAVNGVECIVLEKPAGGPPFGLQSRVWVDPDRDFVPRKFEEKVIGESGVWYVCDFEKHSMGIYLPSRWEAHFGDEEHVTAQVTRIETGLELPDSEFTIEFPPDTVVADRVADEEYYIDPAGQKTTQEEFKQRVVASQAAANRREPWGAIVAAVATIGVIVVLLCRRRFSS